MTERQTIADFLDELDNRAGQLMMDGKADGTALEFIARVRDACTDLNLTDTHVTTGFFQQFMARLANNENPPPQMGSTP